MKKLTLSLVILTGLISAAILDVQTRYLDRLYDPSEEIRRAPTGIILGASVKRNGEPSPALRDRLTTGLDLYKRGLVQNLLITGDDGQFHIDEIRVMREFLTEHGVPSENIREDGHGYRTYESCKRAAEVFEITEAIVVTQRFHMGRALYLCNKLGLDAAGVTSDLTAYDNLGRHTARDLAASLKAWWDINVQAPKPPVDY